jgi:hypothetical protein
MDKKPGMSVYNFFDFGKVPTKDHLELMTWIISSNISLVKDNIDLTGGDNTYNYGYNTALLDLNEELLELIGRSF